MRFFSLLACMVLVAGCSSGVVYKEAPSQAFKPQKVVQLRGNVSPVDLYFTALTLFAKDKTRVIVLGDMGIKLLDFQVTPKGKAEVYYKMPRIPDYFAQAFTRMAKSELLTEPARRVVYKDAQTRLVFEAERGDDAHD